MGVGMLRNVKAGTGQLILIEYGPVKKIKIRALSTTIV
mgnify:CR=1 FL=1